MTTDFKLGFFVEINDLPVPLEKIYTRFFL